MVQRQKLMDRLKSLPHIGLRNVKTSMAIFTCLIIYYLLQRTGVLLAAIAAVMCMQDTIEKSLKDGMNRVLGTCIGGFFGICFVSLPVLYTNPVYLFSACAVCVSMIIYFMNLIKKQKCTAITLMVFLIITMDPNLDAPMSYAINRVIDTIIGIAVAVVVNRALPVHHVGRIASGNGPEPMLKFTLRRSYQHIVSAWNGGTTTEIFIFPEGSHYIDHDFKWRLSSATTTKPKSRFSELPGYKRYIMVLEGHMRLVHTGQHTADMAPLGCDYFDGGWDTHSYGFCTDFNVILADGLTGSLSCAGPGEAIILNKRAVTCYYSLADNAVITVTQDEKPVFSEKLNKGDFISFEGISKLNRSCVSIISVPNSDETQPVAVVAEIFEDANADESS